MMKNQKGTSPFSALTFEEQQQKWLLWRSQQLNYQDYPMDPAPENANIPSPIQLPDPVMLPQEHPNTYRHSQLDSIYSRHRQAFAHTGIWQSTVREAAHDGSKQ